MIDHIEGWIRLNRAVRELHAATTDKDFDLARALCAEIATDARLVAAQLSIEEEKHGLRNPDPDRV